MTSAMYGFYRLQNTIYERTRNTLKYPNRNLSNIAYY